ncbi:hypothetical protein FHS56_000451 [Thermonema lapsum]|uniref:HTTM domain-containing protein n=1 Tax=Thermonema lapsum TaxID=28195 RepID=A0A846MNE0_9BACT|nr:hypothetical protein [Thermonema lapsum]NIK72965.1 hypothetical protein [Thermonema lapsum]
MKTTYLKNSLWVLSVLLALGGMYGWWLRPQVQAFLWTGEANIVSYWVAVFYPRFAIERHRFDASYFLFLADQIVLRAGLVITAIAIWEAWQRRGQRAFCRIIPLSEVGYFVRYFAFVLLLYTYDWCYLFYNLSFFVAFFEPLGFVHFLPAFSLPWLWSLWGVMILTALRALYLGRGSFLPASLFLVLQAYLYSFGKLDHTFAPFTYVCLLMPWWEVACWRAQKKGFSFCSATPLLYMQVAIAFCYVQAGMEKLLLGGSAWWNANHLRTFLLVHGQATGRALAASPDLLLEAASVLVLLWQLAFVGVLHPKSRLFFIFTGFLFHLANYLFLGVGWWLHTYVWCYPFFFDSLSGLRQFVRFLKINAYRQKQ